MDMSLSQPTSVSVIDSDIDSDGKSAEVILMADQDREDGGTTEITEYMSCAESGTDTLEPGDLVFDPERDMWVTIRMERSEDRQEEDSLWVWEVRKNKHLEG